jgi:hypothetical protein
MSVPNNTVRTREFTFAFEPKPNPKTGSEEQVMDKIPAALQHKIDYINALDIPDKSKVSRITIATLDYQAYCRARSLSEKSSVSLKGTVLENLATLLDKYNEDAAKKWEKFEGKGLQSAKNPPPMPPVMPPKRVIKNGVKFQGRNKPDKFAYQLSCCLWVGSFVLCGLIGLVLGVAFGSSL